MGRLGNLINSSNNKKKIQEVNIFVTTIIYLMSIKIIIYEKLSIVPAYVPTFGFLAFCGVDTPSNDWPKQYG